MPERTAVKKGGCNSSSSCTTTPRRGVITTEAAPPAQPAQPAQQGQEVIEVWKRWSDTNQAATAAHRELVRQANSLKYRHPKEVYDVLLCHATTPLTESKRLQLRLQGAPVTRVGPGASSKTVKATLNLSRDQARQLVVLDDIIMNSVKANTQAWFDGTMDDALLEDYYRPLVTVDSTPSRGGGNVCAKITMAAKHAADLREGHTDVVLQLIGVQFRRQNFTSVWRMLDAVKSNSGAAAAPPQDYGFVSDDEENRDKKDDDDAETEEQEEEEEEEGAAPAWDEYEDMRKDTLAKLQERLTAEHARLREIQHAMEALATADNQDMEALDHASAVVMTE